MASSTPEAILTKAKELGKYSELTDFSSGNGRPHEKSRVLAAEDVDTIRMCGGCGKYMARLKTSLVCSCKRALHCSKDCFKSSKHKCQQHSVDKNMQGIEVLRACDKRYLTDRKTKKGPSSEKVTSLLKTTKGSHQRILKYAERGIPMAAYIVGVAYMEREFDPSARFAIPLKYKEQSVAVTNEIAVKWLKVAAEGGVPEAMFCMYRVLVTEDGLRVDQRVALYWLDKAYATGSMDYLIQIFQTPMCRNFPDELKDLLDSITENCKIYTRPSLTTLLMATRFRELAAWDGKTATGEPFYAFPIFKSIMELIGELKKEQSGPSFIEGEKQTIVVIPARPGFSDFIDKSLSFQREENNLRFLQGAKEKVSLDYQLAGQTKYVGGRTSYLISCKHDQVNLEEKYEFAEYIKIGGLRIPVKEPLVDIIKNYRSAGECEPCIQEAKGRLRAVSLGLFSISVTPAFEETVYAARYANEDGVIVQDVFDGYSKPDIRQMLQCLMSNPADLHPVAVAEEADLYWPIVWFWGSVYQAVQDSCDKTTLDAIYGSAGGKNSVAKSKNASALAALAAASALAAFPEAAAGEVRIACGNEKCPKVDHEVKFNLCAGCWVRRYCHEDCQRKDWEKHRQFCKAGKQQDKRKN